MRQRQALRQPEHVDGAMHGRLGRLHGIMLVMDRGGGAGEVVDFVDFDVERKGDVVPNELEARVRVQVFNIAFCASEEIIDAYHVVALGSRGGRSDGSQGSRRRR